MEVKYTDKIDKNLPLTDLISRFERIGFITRASLNVQSSSPLLRGISISYIPKPQEQQQLLAIATDEQNRTNNPTGPSPILPSRLSLLQSSVPTATVSNVIDKVKDKREKKSLICEVPKDVDNDEFIHHFAKFGEIESCSITSDKDERRMTGVIKYLDPEHTDLAYQKCNPKYRPRYAYPVELPQPVVEEPRKRLHAVCGQAVDAASYEQHEEICRRQREMITPKPAYRLAMERRKMAPYPCGRVEEVQRQMQDDKSSIEGAPQYRLPCPPKQRISLCNQPRKTC